MAETSYLWNNPGVGDSPAAPGYGDDVLMATMCRMLLNGTGNRGVLRSWRIDELVVTNGGALNAAVGRGGAVVYGRFYENTTATTVALPNNSVVWVVVRCSWAAQTIRLAQVAALVQNPGVTYDIPLAQVTTAGGIITVITDAREFCEYTTDLHDDVVDAIHIQTDAVTTAKPENQTRHVTRAAGMFQLDATNPPTWATNNLVVPYRMQLQFSDIALNVIWCTFRVPADISSATMSVYLWNYPYNSIGVGTVRWGYNALTAQPSAVLAAAAGTQDVLNTGRDRTTMYRDLLCALTVSSGDIVHIEIYRDGAAGADTFTTLSMLVAAEFEYTADS